VVYDEASPILGFFLLFLHSFGLYCHLFLALFIPFSLRFATASDVAVVTAIQFKKCYPDIILILAVISSRKV